MAEIWAEIERIDSVRRRMSLRRTLIALLGMWIAGAISLVAWWNGREGWLVGSLGALWLCSLPLTVAIFSQFRRKEAIGNRVRAGEVPPVGRGETSSQIAGEFLRRAGGLPEQSWQRIVRRCHFAWGVPEKAEAIRVHALARAIGRAAHTGGGAITASLVDIRNHIESIVSVSAVPASPPYWEVRALRNAADGLAVAAFLEPYEFCELYYPFQDEIPLNSLPTSTEPL